MHDHSTFVSRSCIAAGSLDLQEQSSVRKMGRAGMFWRRLHFIVHSSKFQSWRREDISWWLFQLSNEQQLIRGDQHVGISIRAHQQQVFNAGTLASSSASRRSQSCIFSLKTIDIHQIIVIQTNYNSSSEMNNRNIWKTSFPINLLSSKSPGGNIVTSFPQFPAIFFLFV